MAFGPTTVDQRTPPPDEQQPPAPTEKTDGAGAWTVQPRARWSTPVMVLMSILAGGLYFHRLTMNGPANDFYAAAVKSGTVSWKAFFFGSLDPASFITVDKPPAFLWIMEISTRVFGYSNFTMLAPVALVGAATVAVLFHIVRKWHGDIAAVLAAAALGLTPVFTTVVRFNDPDAFMLLFLVLAAWAMQSALETGRTSRLIVCSVMLGLAFLSKYLEAFIALPAFVVVYLLFGPPKLARRFLQLAWGLVALVIASGWWVTILQLWPPASRPYIDSSTDNSLLSLIFEYNGFGRLFGTSAPTGDLTPAQAEGLSRLEQVAHFGSTPGLGRIFATALGSQISWFMPFALLGLVAGIWQTRREPRTDSARSGFVFSGVWLVTGIVVLSETQGVFHPYYTDVLAPPMAALAGGGAVAIWRLSRESRVYLCALLVAIAGTALWEARVLERAGYYAPHLPRLVEIAGIGGAVLIVLAALGSRAAPKALFAATLALGSVTAAAAAFAGPAMYSAYTVQHLENSDNPTGGPPPGSLAPKPFSTNPKILKIVAHVNQLFAETTDHMLSFVEHHRDGATWILAVSGSGNAAPFIISSGEPVMSMGGFTAAEPAPTLAYFKALVAAGRIQYVLVGGGLVGGIGGIFGPHPGLSPAQALAEGLPDLSRPGLAGATIIDDWAIRNGVLVPSADYHAAIPFGTYLYYVGPKAKLAAQT